jgi:hypothetical protein
MPRFTHVACVIDTYTPPHRRALITSLTCPIVRIGARLKMKVTNFWPKSAGWEPDVMPHRLSLAERSRPCINANGIAEGLRNYLFRTARGP